jgi:hypothetical protein
MIDTDSLLSNVPLEPYKPTYSIPIYENGIKTEWVVEGIVGDDKWNLLIEAGNGSLPDMINTNTRTKH